MKRSLSLSLALGLVLFGGALPEASAAEEGGWWQRVKSWFGTGGGIPSEQELIEGTRDLANTALQHSLRLLQAGAESEEGLLSVGGAGRTLGGLAGTAENQQALQKNLDEAVVAAYERAAPLVREVVAGWEIEDAKALLTADGPAVTNRLKQSHGETIEAHLKAAVATVAEQMDLEERFGESLGGLASRLPTGRASAENLIAGQAVELFFDSLGAAEAAVRTNPDLQPRSLRRLLERL